MSHTPGPWIPMANHDSAPIYIYEKSANKLDDPTPIAVVTADQRENADPVANANLIAAAPELLDALEFLVDKEISFSCNSQDGSDAEKAFNLIRSAISKARGES